jgi:hypothetical protein
LKKKYRRKTSVMTTAAIAITPIPDNHPLTEDMRSITLNIIPCLLQYYRGRPLPAPAPDGPALP